jgi:phosphatidate cytidylyltransferase
MQRVLTGLVAVPIALAVVFLLPGSLVLAAAIGVFGGAAVEYVHLVPRWAPSAPLWIVPVAAVGLAVGLYALLHSGWTPHTASVAVVALIAGFGALLAVSGLAVLFSTARMPEAMIGAGLIHFGVPYFAMPMVCVYLLVTSDPWLLALLLFAVWVGDTFAYVFGSRFGRTKMAPVISPNKTWEGSAAGFVGALLTAVFWCLARQGAVDLSLVAVTGAAAVAGQVGDLLESLIKRGVGVKDSSSLLPGHGGLFDRMDAVLLAAPAFVLGLWLLESDLLSLVR